MTLTKDFNCLLCETNADLRVISQYLRDDEKGKHQIVKCLNCGHIQVFPLPTVNEKKFYYDNDQQIKSTVDSVNIKSHQNKTKTDNIRRVEWLKAVTTAWHKKFNILDVGCGYGFFVDQAFKLDYKAYGIDISSQRVNIANKYMQGHFINSYIDNNFADSNANNFSVITLFHVLEHISCPLDLLLSCFRMLKKGGYLLIEVPNINDELVNNNDNYNLFYWQKAHLSYFDHASLELIFNKLYKNDYNIRGLQRYGLRNILNWVDKGEPQIENPAYSDTNPLIKKHEERYKRYKEKNLTCDTLIAEIKKK